MMFGLHMFNEMEKIQREMDQLLGGLGANSALSRLAAAGDFKLKNVEGGYQVEATLPGIDVETLEIKVLGRRLQVSGEPAGTGHDENITWHRRERARGAFSRTLMLPAEIDSEKVEAQYINGVLSILLPKAASALPKRIDVKAG